MSVSSIDVGQLWFSLGGFLLFYTVLLVIEVYLMLKYVRLGPSSLGTGKYHFEARQPTSLNMARGIQHESL